jgi:hypothetical protein
MELLVEVTPVAGSEPTSRIDDAAAAVGDAFARAQETIVEIATKAVGVIEEAGRRAASPKQLEIEFGLKFSAQGNVIVAGASGEATLQVKLTYERAQAAAPSG